MKFITTLLNFLAITNAAVIGRPIIDSLTGKWIQVYSNYFVQSTSEIDWKCVNINIEGNNKTVNITTKALLHGIENEYVQITNTYNVSNERNTTTFTNKKEKLELRKWGLLEDKFDYIILTPANNISLFVWTRNFPRFMNEYNTDVLNTLYEWDYSGLYKAPLFSYTTRCIE